MAWPIKKMKTSVRILIVEDEVELAAILRQYLEREQYQVKILSNGSTATETILSGDWDLVLLDLMLPGKDGLTICTEVRRTSNVPIIMLTAKVEEVDRLIGLRLGADDYVCKPYSPREVVARVDAVLRRARAPGQAEPHAMDAARDLQVDENTMEITCGAKHVALTLVEFNLLQALINKPIRIHSRNDLMDIAYPDNRIVNDRTIDSHINKLRKKLKSVTGENNIRSIYGAGYKLELS